MSEREPVGDGSASEGDTVMIDGDRYRVEKTNTDGRIISVRRENSDSGRGVFIALATTWAVGDVFAWYYALTTDAPGVTFYQDPVAVILASPLWVGVATLMSVISLFVIYSEINSDSPERGDA